MGITMGDPAGIGPEIIAKALSDPEIYRFCQPVVFDDREGLSRNIRKAEALTVREIHPSEARGHLFGSI